MPSRAIHAATVGQSRGSAASPSNPLIPYVHHHGPGAYDRADRLARALTMRARTAERESIPIYTWPRVTAT